MGNGLCRDVPRGKSLGMERSWHKFPKVTLLEDEEEESCFPALLDVIQLQIKTSESQKSLGWKEPLDIACVTSVLSPFCLWETAMQTPGAMALNIWDEICKAAWAQTASEAMSWCCRPPVPITWIQGVHVRDCSLTSRHSLVGLGGNRRDLHSLVSLGLFWRVIEWDSTCSEGSLLFSTIQTYEWWKAE